MKIGIVGLKNAGKSTLFDILTGHISSGIEKPGEVRNGIFTVNDDRVDFIRECFDSKKKSYSNLELVDLPTLEFVKNPDNKNASKILEEARNCDAIIQVIREFSNPSVPFPEFGVDPLQEKRTFDSELILTNLITVENRLERIEAMKKKLKDYAQPGEVEVLQLFRKTLEDEKPLSSLDLDSNSEKLIRGFQFMTLKPRINIINLDEGHLGEEKDIISRMEAEFPSEKGAFEAVCCQAEKEILELPEDEREEFRSEMGIKEGAVRKVVEKLISTLKLIRFLTGGDTEARSWLIPEGLAAPAAGGTIHTDIEKGFIRAEVIKYADMLVHKSEGKCKEKGCYRLEGKEYRVEDGDIIYFRFNV
ncbi:DUF933 domain-containing protein [candidate division KSB1 bacterium]